jgi:hypothetical protein
VLPADVPLHATLRATRHSADAAAGNAIGTRVPVGAQCVRTG